MRSLLVLAGLLVGLLVSSTALGQCLNGVCFLPQRQAQQQRRSYSPNFATTYAPQQVYEQAPQFDTYYTSAPAEVEVTVHASAGCQGTACSGASAGAHLTHGRHGMSQMPREDAASIHGRSWRLGQFLRGSRRSGRCS